MFCIWTNHSLLRGLKKALDTFYLFNRLFTMGFKEPFLTRLLGVSAPSHVIITHHYKVKIRQVLLTDLKTRSRISRQSQFSISVKNGSVLWNFDKTVIMMSSHWNLLSRSIIWAGRHGKKCWVNILLSRIGLVGVQPQPYADDPNTVFGVHWRDQWAGMPS